VPDLERRFIKTVRDTGILPPGSRVAAAVSGGSDSLAMLRMLCAFRSHMDWDLYVLHIHHGVREQSESEAERVRATARLLDLPFVLRSLDPPGRGSLEAGLSRMRQEVYEAEGREGSLVAVGHTATDRAETLLMRMLEGAGLRGLGGMSFWGVGPVRRPMLRMERGELQEYLRAQSIGWVRDQSNRDTAILRNALRHRVFPVLEEISPGAAGRMAASAELLSGWRDFARRATSEAVEGLRTAGGLDRRGYQELPRQLRLSVLWAICGRPRKGREELEKTDRWLMDGGTGSHAMPGGAVLEAETETLSTTEARDGSEPS